MRKRLFDWALVTVLWVVCSGVPIGFYAYSGDLSAKFIEGWVWFSTGLALISFFFVVIYDPITSGEDPAGWQRLLFTAWVTAQQGAVFLMGLLIVVEGIPFIYEQYRWSSLLMAVCVPGLVYWSQNLEWRRSGRWPKRKLPYGQPEE